MNGLVGGRLLVGGLGLLNPLKSGPGRCDYGLRLLTVSRLNE